MADIFIDDAKRKKIVSFWIPVSLTFLHVWGCALISAVTIFDRHNDTIDKMFSTCGWGIALLVFLLISNNGLELVRVLVASKISNAIPQTTEKTITEKTVITTPAMSTSTDVQNVDMKVNGDVNVSSS